VTCSICNAPCDQWRYRYHGDIYCKECFHEHFELLQCHKCKKMKYIHYKTKPTPTCKICQIDDTPCIRCKRPVTRFGKITKAGQVCASCSRYFIEPRRCELCDKVSFNVFTRTIDHTKRSICTSCYEKTLPVCHLCQRKKKDGTYNVDGKFICTACQEEPRVCEQCGSLFPAGRGRICMECSAKNGLMEKVNFASGALPDLLAEYYRSFAAYLIKKRGAQFASHRILHFFKFFQELEEMMKTTMPDDSPSFPSYEEIIEYFSVAYTRKYLTVMQFFEHEGIIKWDREIQAVYADLDMIDRYLDAFRPQTFFGKIIRRYHSFLNEKYSDGDISARTLRLSMTPAVKYLQYCQFLNEETPTQDILDGYMYCIPGQRNSISPFISFLKNSYGYDLKHTTKRQPPIALERPLTSKEQRRQRFIKMMRSLNGELQTKRIYNQEDILRITIEYLHDIKVPNDKVMISFLPIKKRDKDHFIRFAGREFYLPSESS